MDFVFRREGFQDEKVSVSFAASATIAAVFDEPVDEATAERKKRRRTERRRERTARDLRRTTRREMPLTLTPDFDH